MCVCLCVCCHTSRPSLNALRLSSSSSLAAAASKAATSFSHSATRTRNRAARRCSLRAAFFRACSCNQSAGVRRSRNCGYARSNTGLTPFHPPQRGTNPHLSITLKRLQLIHEAGRVALHDADGLLQLLDLRQLLPLGFGDLVR